MGGGTAGRTLLGPLLVTLMVGPCVGVGFGGSTLGGSTLGIAVLLVEAGEGAGAVLGTAGLGLGVGVTGEILATWDAAGVAGTHSDDKAGFTSVSGAIF